MPLHDTTGYGHHLYHNPAHEVLPPSAYGNSATFYGVSLSHHHFQGVCQGNGVGPAFRLALSLCLICMLHQFGFPKPYLQCNLALHYCLDGFMYLDDCDHFVLSPPSNLKLQAVLQTLQHNLDIWQGGLEATSGMLSLEKYSCSRLFYYFKAGQWKLHFPTALCYTPALFGLGLPNIYQEQGTAALHLFLEVSNSYSTDIHLLYCSLEQGQLELGIATPLFQANYTQYGFLLSDCWVKFLWFFLAYAKFSLHTDTSLDLGFQQVND